MRGLVRRIAVSVIGVMVLGPCWAHAQITTGTITGSVKDQQGAMIPGATVVLDQRNARHEERAGHDQRQR